jgi:hypothetical protein
MQSKRATEDVPPGARYLSVLAAGTVASAALLAASGAVLTRGARQKKGVIQRTVRVPDRHRPDASELWQHLLPRRVRTRGSRG